jgi:hypothetical protein
VGHLPSRVDCAAMYRGHSLFLCSVCSYSMCVYLSRFDIIIVINVSTVTNIIITIMYKGICTCQAYQSGHCAAHYANCINLQQFRHLNDRMPDRHQV